MPLRYMADSTNAANMPTLRTLLRHRTFSPTKAAFRIVARLPAGWDLYAGYVDGRWQTYGPAVLRFGSARVVPIAVFSTTNAGLVGDVENGDMTPQTAVSWVVMRRKAGVDPTIYCSLSLWPTVRAAFQTAGVPEPHYWIAAYPGNGEQLYPGSIAHQYADVGPYDASVVAVYWPGFDASPSPAPTSGEDEMFPKDPDQLYFNFCIRDIWYGLRDDDPPAQWFDLMWKLWQAKTTQDFGPFGHGFDKIWDKVLSNVHDTAGAHLKKCGGAGPRGPAGPKGPAGPSGVKALGSALVKVGQQLLGSK